MPQKSQTSLMSVAHVAPPSTAANRAEIDDDDEHRSAEQKNGGTEQAGQERSGLFDVDRSTGQRNEASRRCYPRTRTRTRTRIENFEESKTPDQYDLSTALPIRATRSVDWVDGCGRERAGAVLIRRGKTSRRAAYSTRGGRG